MNSEGQLLQDVIQKRSDAIKILYEKHAPAFLSLCLRYCGNVEDAEDVLHDGFIKIIKNIHSFKTRDGGSFTGWMKRIMVNTSLNHLRYESRKKRFTDINHTEVLWKVTDDEKEDNMINPDRFSQEMLMKMICELPVGYRTVFNMYVFEEFSHREIAGILNFSENTSKSQLSKARAMLKKKISEVMIKQTT